MTRFKKSGSAAEGDVKRVICDYLALCHKDIKFWLNFSMGFFDPTAGFFKKNTSKYAMNGTSDILGILPDGRLLAIEVKSYKGRHRKDQEEFIAMINANNGVAFFAHSVSDVQRGLRCLKNSADPK